MPPPAAPLPSLGLLVGALLALILSETAGSRPGCLLSKPAASAGFVWAAAQAGARGSDYGRAVLLALALSWLGDALLLGTSDLAFSAGLGSFLLAHLAYASAFLGSGVSWRVAGAALLALALTARVVVRWVWPGVPAALRFPVLAYSAAITAMLAFAVGAWGSLPRPGLAAAGALLFLLSDVCVAAQRFKGAGLGSKLVGLPLYYAGQVMLACSVAGPGSRG